MTIRLVGQDNQQFELKAATTEKMCPGDRNGLLIMISSRPWSPNVCCQLAAESRGHRRHQKCYGITEDEPAR